VCKQVAPNGFIELDLESGNCGPVLLRCLSHGEPACVVIRGRAADRLRPFVSDETIPEWARLSAIPSLNLLCVAIALTRSHSAHYRVLADAESFRVEFFPALA